MSVTYVHSTGVANDNNSPDTQAHVNNSLQVFPQRILWQLKWTSPVRNEQEESPESSTVNNNKTRYLVDTIIAQSKILFGKID